LLILRQVRAARKAGPAPATGKKETAMSRRHTFFMLLKTEPAWLAKSRAERLQFLGAVIRPILAKYPGVALRFYDAEAFTGRCTDVAVWETADLRQYYFLVDALRDTAFFAAPYFTVVDIVPAIEDGYAEYDRAGGDAAAAGASA
jgi:hypothetical protein